ncbi:MAG: M15 family metallopeptidase [Spirochaetes bacterium]|nr:M15 family metallopeptidase [Spirochaetota bacterium]
MTARTVVSAYLDSSRLAGSLLLAVSCLLASSCRSEATVTDSRTMLHPDYWLFGRDLPRIVEGLPRTLAAAIETDPRLFLEDCKPLLRERRDCIERAWPSKGLGDWAPDDLRSFPAGGILGDRPDLSLRAPALAALLSMANAARQDGIDLRVSSAWRSRDYQESLHGRYLSRADADRVATYSMKPGLSQHQLGTAVDFAGIGPAFAATPEGRWLAAHAREHGFSLSYPAGAETLTGMRWEPWHYLYLGTEACDVQRAWFGDSQRLMARYFEGQGELLARSRFR